MSDGTTFAVEWEERPDPHDFGTRYVGPFPSMDAAQAYASAYATERGGSWSWGTIRLAPPEPAVEPSADRCTCSAAWLASHYPHEPACRLWAGATGSALVAVEGDG